MKPRTVPQALWVDGVVSVQRIEWQRVWQRMVRGCVASILLVFLASCSSPQKIAGVGPGDTVDPVRNADFSARFPPSASGQSTRTGASSGPQLFPGSDVKPTSPDRSGGGAINAAMKTVGVNVQGAGIEINFENADIQTVAKTILSDTLGLNVVIDPRVQGTVTLVSAAPIPRKDLMAAFESVMRMSNAAVIHEGGLVKIVPLPEAAGAGTVNMQTGEAGFGVTVIPLRYTSAATVVKAAENFLSRPGAVRADTTRNLLMIQGTAAERQNVLEVISSFDVEWMRNQSAGIYPLKSTSPDTMIHELERVFETADGGQGQGLISFQPITRMNAVMAVAHNRKFLDQTTEWIRRLDRSDIGGTTVRIYRLEYGSAPKIAKIVNAIFVGQNGNATADTAAKQLAPGVNGALSRLDTIGSSNNNSGSSSGSSANSQSSNGVASNGVANGSNTATASSFDGFSDKKGVTTETQASGSLPHGVFENVRIAADPSDNSIVIYSNLDDYRVIERSLRELDRPQLQVAIEATIAEVTLTNALQYGVQYYLGSTDVHAGSNNGSISLSTSPTSAVISQALPGLNVLLGSQSSPKVILSALQSLTSVKVLSAPSLVVSDNQPAFLQVGDSVPISTGSATVLSAQNTVVNTITMQDTGIILKVWPHIHANGTVELEIEQEVSGVVGGISATGTSNLNPTISQRRVHSTVQVPSGQTVLLGGLMSEEDDKTQTGIPILRQIEGLGDMFGNTNGSKVRTEIIIFVKPRIIRDSLDAQNVAEEFRAGMSTMHHSPAIISGIGVSAPKEPSSALVVK
ncbi:MAG: type II secretion system secretin GspD [Methylovirgula sp.]